MNLEDALGDDNQSDIMWPGANPNPNPVWPGQPSPFPQPSQPSQPSPFPQPSQPSPFPQPSQPSPFPQPSHPNNPAWPSPSLQPSHPNNPAWPSPSLQPSHPNNPAWPSPSLQPSHPNNPAWPSPSLQPSQPAWSNQQHPRVPFKQSLPNGVYDKLLITIAGTIKPNADKITVDLCSERDVTFHFNPRFNESGKKVIVRNSRMDSKWGQEERALSRFPFIKGQPFEMKILCTKSEFKVAVNNSHLLEYKHRCRDLRSINQLEIYNDLTLSKVTMENVP